MNNKRLMNLAAGFLLLGGGNVLAHGGQYRGPGDTVPPNPGSSGPTPSGPTTPSNPGPSGPTPPTPPPTGAPPSTGNPTGTPPGGMPGVPGRQTAVTGIGPLEFDLTEWTFWWEFNKEPYLNLKRAIGAPEESTGGSGLLGGLFGERGRKTNTLRPSLEQLREVAVPALERALRETGNRDMSSACLIALAKIGQSRTLGEMLKAHMLSKDQEISETAVLAHGIAGLESSLPDLLEIFRDSVRGRSLVGDSPRVNYRKQSFAGYALGLIAHATTDPRIKRTVYEAAREVLESTGRFAGRDVPVAALQAIRLLKPDLSNPEGRRLAIDACRFLIDFLKEAENPSQARAQVPVALSRLLGRNPGPSGAVADDLAAAPGQALAGLRREALELCLEILHDRKAHTLVVQSCTLALGQMAHPADEKALRTLDLAASGELSRDHQVRNFALISLGCLGGDEARTNLVVRLGKAGATREKPWIGLALGILVADRIASGGAPDPLVGDALADAFDRMKNPSWKAAFAVALGLARHKEAGLKILEEMGRSRDLDLRGYCAVGLGLMDYTDAAPALRALLDRSGRFPELLRQVAIGLGLVGDKTVVRSLLKALADGSRTVAAQAPLASGLGYVGDQRCVTPLVDMLFDKRIADLSRAFAAVALGLVGDKEDLPWNSKIGSGINYRANVETLTGNSTGILDLL